MLDHSFWAGKRVLLTGHTGFKEVGSAFGCLILVLSFAVMPFSQILRGHFLSI